MSFEIVFMGTSEFAKELLEHIHSNQNFNIKGVYTELLKKKDNGQKTNMSQVHQFAKEKNLNIFFTSEFSNSEIENLKKIKPDVILVADYGLILPEEVLMIPSCGPVKVHTSLLPKWRGLAPIHRSIMNGDTMTGISIMKMEKESDQGPTFIQTQIPIRENDTYKNVFKTLVEAAKQTLDVYFEGHQPFWPIQQDPNEATYADKIKTSEMEIKFDNSAFDAHKKVCALSPEPGAWIEINSQKYKIFDTEYIIKDKIKNFINSENMILSLKKDYLLVKKIQKNDENIMTIEEFTKNYPKELEDIKKKFS